jgi:peptidoglycan/xylan/chitin deacetylase (PgdA/CDA1 family)
MNFRNKCSAIVLLVLLYFAVSQICYAQSYGDITVKIWAHNKKAAFSFTFDDGCMSQYTYAAPVLDTFKFKGTFFVITDSTTNDLPGIARYGTWNQFRSMALDGHEIGSHTVTHPDLTTLALGDTSTSHTLLYELYQSQKAIQQKIISQKCITLSYPDLTYDSLVMAESSLFYAAARTGGNFPVDASLGGIEFYKIVAKEELFNLPRNSTADDLDELADFEVYVDSCIKVGKWGLSEIHEVVPFAQIPTLVSNGEWFPMSSEWLTSLCQFMKQKSDSNLVWVETMGNIVRYEYERQDFMYDVLLQTATQLQIHGYDTLDDAIYNYPLTVDITVPPDWRKVGVNQGTTTDTVYTFAANGSTYVRANVIPDGGTIILNKLVAVITLTSPNGGENWKAGEVDSIKWTSANVKKVNIQLTTNNGTSWSTIKDSVSASAGHYTWTIPDSPSTQCKVRLTDVADTNIMSMSADTFTIAVVPVITIISPNGGENWRVGGIDTVKWTSSYVTYAKLELTTNKGTSWSTIIDSTSASVGRYAWTIPDSISTQCKVRLTDVADTNIKSMSADTFTIVQVQVITLSALIEGLYDGTKMKPDTVTMELYNSFSPFTMVDSTKGVLDTTGTGIFIFIKAVNDTPYYFAIRHKNAIETWSAAAHSFTSYKLSYDFTTKDSQAYGNNLVLKGGKYCIYSGDVNQDGLIDLSDLIAIDNDNLNYLTGFAITDVNGDGLVDLSDLIIADNNNLKYVVKNTPQVTPSTTAVRNRVQKVSKK